MTFFVFLLAVILLSLGTFLAKKEIKGSCGGLNCPCEEPCEEKNKI